MIDKEYYKRKYVKKQRVRYMIYNLEDNYITEGTLDELCIFLKRNKKSLVSSISHIKYHRKNRKYILFEGKKYEIVKVED